MPSLTGAMADHRRALRPGEIERLAARLVGTAGTKPPALDPWSTAALDDLQEHRGRGLVLAGDFQPASVHAAARTLNDALGNTGETVEYLADEDCGAARRGSCGAGCGDAAWRSRGAGDPRRESHFHDARRPRFLRRACRGSRSRFITALTTTKRRSVARGTCRPPIFSRNGAMRARQMVRSRLCSR